VSDAQKLTARDAEVLWAIRTFFEENRYKTALHFDEVLEACPENIVAGILMPTLERLVLAGFLGRNTRGLFSLTPLGLGVMDKRNSFDKGTFTAFCDLLLVALANHSEQQVTKFDAFDLRVIAELYALEFTPGWIEGASEVFEKRDLAKIKRLSESEQDGLISAALTGPGLLEAERLRKELLERGILPPTYPPLDVMKRVNQSLTQPDGSTLSVIRINEKLSSNNILGFVPASDRSVRLDDNAPGRKEAIEKLQELEKVLTSGSNDLNLSADDRQVAVDEIKPFRERLEQRRVRIGEVYNAVTKGSTLIWLLDKVGGHAVAGIIAAALTALGLLAKALIG
jgi:hypothetical protein